MLCNRVLKILNVPFRMALSVSMFLLSSLGVDDWTSARHISSHPDHPLHPICKALSCVNITAPSYSHQYGAALLFADGYRCFLRCPLPISSDSRGPRKV